MNDLKCFVGFLGLSFSNAPDARLLLHLSWSIDHFFRRSCLSWYVWQYLSVNIFGYMAEYTVHNITESHLRRCSSVLFSHLSKCTCVLGVTPPSGIWGGTWHVFYWQLGYEPFLNLPLQSVTQSGSRKNNIHVKLTQFSLIKFNSAIMADNQTNFNF